MCWTKAATSLDTTSEGPESCSRKSHQSGVSCNAGFDALPCASIVPLTICNFGKRRYSVALTSLGKSGEAHKRTSDQRQHARRMRDVADIENLPRGTQQNAQWLLRDNGRCAQSEGGGGLREKVSAGDRHRIECHNQQVMKLIVS